MRDGDYFGEISLIYDCKRSATVISDKYTTVGVLTKENFKKVITSFPEFIGLFKEGVYKYNDKTTKLTKEIMKKVEYF